ncbi:MAG: OmpH family outer membrane protein [Candidatus Omnitrophota bacterium]
MKRLVVFTVVCVLVLTGSAYAADKFVCVDIAKIFDEYNKTKDLDEQLQNKKTDRDNLINEMKTLNEGMDLLSDKAKQERQQQIADKEKELRQLSEDLLRERDELARKILEEIQSVIEEQSKKNGYVFVFNDRLLLYKDKKLDITDDIIKILNTGYKKGK